MSYLNDYIPWASCTCHSWSEQSNRYLFFTCKNPLKDYHDMCHTIYTCGKCSLQVCGGCTKDLPGKVALEPEEKQTEWLPPRAGFRCLEDVPHFKWLLARKLEERKRRKEAVEGPRIRIANDEKDWIRKEKKEESEKDRRARLLEESRMRIQRTS